MWILTKGEYTVTNLEDGRGISKTESTYQKSTSGTVVPTGTWTTNIPSVGAGEYLWTRTLFTYTDNTTSSTYTVGRMGTNGNNGLGISNNSVHYQASSSGTTAPTGTWTATIPTVAANQYLWTRTTITYTDGSTSISYSVGKMGADGKDAQLLYLTASSQIQAFDKDDKPKTTQAITISAKLQNASGTATFVAIPYIGNVAQTAITLGGTGNDRTLLPSQWTNSQWTTIAITATLGSLTDTISVIKVKDGDTGAKGSDGIAGKDGVGVSNTNITYAQSTSGTTPPTTGWSAQVPTLVKGQYLWTRTIWSYTDNTTETGYTVSYNAKDGNDGSDGIAGKDGVGIASTKVEYVGSSSGTVKPTTGWSTTIPAVAEGNYLWTKTTWTYTDDTNETGYSVSRMGETGAKGDKGDSATSYWITPSVNTIQISATKVINPTTITFTGYSKTGTANAGLYSGRFNILTSVDGIVYSSKYSSSANQSAYTYTVPADVKFIKAKMYQAGGFTALVDEVTIPIIESAEGLEIGGRNYFSVKAWNAKPALTINGIPYMDIKLEPNTQYTLSTNIPSRDNLRDVFFLKGTDTPSSSVNGVAKDLPMTLTTNADGIVKVAVRDYDLSSGYWIMLSKGNKATDWAPAPEDAQLYTAWSNKEDGTVDFTRNYPNENIALGTQFNSEHDWKMVWNTTIGIRTITSEGVKVTSTTTSQTGIGDALSRQLAYGDVVTVTFQYRGSGLVEPYFLMNSGVNLLISSHRSSSTTEWQTYTRGYTFPNRTEGIKNFSILTRGTDEWIEIKKDSVKVEIGTRTIYTPSPKDDPVKAEMAYIGYSPKDSNDPADYVWSENPKAKGTFQRWSNVLGGSELSFATVLPTLNIVENGDFLDTVGGTAALNPGIYPNRWGGYNGGVTDPTKNWHAHVDQTTFGYNVVEYNESNGVRNWKAITQSIGTTSDAFAYLQDVKQDIFISLDIYTTMTGASNKVFGGFYYTSKSLGTIAFHAGQFSITPTVANKWQRLSAMVPIKRDDVDWTKSLSFYIYGYGFRNNAIIYIKDINVSEGTSEMFLQSPFEEGNSRFETVPKYIGFGIKDSNNPSDFQWTTNPDYTQALTDEGLDSKVDDETFNDSQDHMNEIIDSKADAQELQDLRDMADNLQQSYEGFIGEGGKHEADLQALEARVEGLIFELDEQVAAFDFVKTHMRLGEEGFEIAEEGSTMKMLLNNNTLSFIDGGKEVASFSNQKFIINQGAIVESLQVGSHKMSRLSDKVTVFQYAPKTTVTN